MTDQATTGTPMVRALYRAVAVPGHESAGLYTKLYYPALYGGTPLENNTGSLPAASRDQPYPVAILMPGINVGPESYGWLATALTEAGFVTLLYGWIIEEMPGMEALSCGLDVSALAPADYGTRPSATALPALLQFLAQQNQSGPLAGLLDLQRILLGGHSAGGSTALLNANATWFPGLCAAFAYGAHSKASTMLGYPADTFLDLPAGLPLLLMGGSEDGVIAASSFRYGGDGDGEPDPIGPLARTFSEALASTRDDSYLAIVRGANHFSLSYPADPATGRPFLDWPVTRPEPEIRADLAELVVQFARAHVLGDAAARQRLRAVLADPTRVQQAAIR